MLIIIGFAMPFNQFFTVFRIIIPDAPSSGIYPDNISGTGANRLIFISTKGTTALFKSVPPLMILTV